MSYSIRFVLRTEKLNSRTGEAPLRIRAIKNKETLYKTVTKIPPMTWDDQKQIVKKSHPQAKIINALLSKRKAEFEQTLLMLECTSDNFGVNALREKLHSSLVLDLFQFAESTIKKRVDHGKIGTAKRDKSAFTKLSKYVGSSLLPIGRVTTTFLEDYRDYLRYELGNSINTVATNLKVIRSVVNRLYREYNLDWVNNPFNNFSIKVEVTERIFLTEKEIATIKSAEISQQNILDRVRDIFLFECFTGLRISDILTLKWSTYTRNGQKRFINTTMRKTGRKIAIPLNHIAFMIMRKQAHERNKRLPEVNPQTRIFTWLGDQFDQLSEIQQYNKINSEITRINKYLKELGRSVGLQKTLSTHVARHTFGTLAVTAGVDLYVISALMGHTNIKTTQIYAKIVDDKKISALDSIEELVWDLLEKK